LQAVVAWHNSCQTYHDQQQVGCNGQTIALIWISGSRRVNITQLRLYTRLYTLGHEHTHPSRRRLHAALVALKDDDETFDELLSPLIREHRETIREGAGLWSNTDAAEGACKAREQMKQDIG